MLSCAGPTMNINVPGKISGKPSDTPIERPIAVGRSAATSSATAAPSGSAGAPMAARGDAVSLTEDARLLQQTAAAAAAAPDIDMDRVDSVRRELAEGRYQIDAEAIAAKLLKTEWELS